MRLRLYIILQIFTFNRIKKKEKLSQLMQQKNMSKEDHTTLTESTVITAIARLYAQWQGLHENISDIQGGPN